MEYRYLLRHCAERYKMEMADDNLYSVIVNSLKEAKIGNCYEEAKLAELIGKINGVKNIYSGKIFFNSDRFPQTNKPLNHEISFITDKTISQDKNYFFKNKDAIILDPWLGITDFAGEYFAKLKHYFCQLFPALPKAPDCDELYRRSYGNSQRYKQLYKQSKIQTDFMIRPDFECRLTNDNIAQLKKDYPELIIDSFKI